MLVVNHVIDEHTNYNLLYTVAATPAEVVLCVDI